MRARLRLSLMILVGSASMLSGTACKSKGSLDSEQKKTVYALGFSIGERLESFDLKKEDIGALFMGIEDSIQKNKAQVEMRDYGSKIQELSMAKMAASAAEEKKSADEFLGKMAAEAGAQKAESGLIFISVQEGTGATPKPTDTVKVHYHGTLRDGKVFDSSVQRGEPAVFPLNQVIPCWTEGVQKIKVGGKAKLVCPSAIAYGDRGSPPDIKPGAALSFEVELLGIVDPGGKSGKTKGQKK